MLIGSMQNDYEKLRRQIAINPDRLDILITALRTAVDIDGTGYLLHLLNQ
jgi:hypothetical protein